MPDNLTREAHADMAAAIQRAHRFLVARCAKRGPDFERQADLLLFAAIARSFTDTLCASPPSGAAELVNLANTALAGSPWQITRRAPN